MRIGLTSSSMERFLTGGKIDGIGTYTKNLYENLLKQGFDVTPFFFPKSKRWFQSSSFPNGRKLPLSYLLSTLSSMISPISKLLYHGLDRQIDLFHSTDHMIPRIQNLPVIATLHDALMFKEPSFYTLSKLKNRIKYTSMGWATHFITVSHTMVAELVEYLGIPEEKISVVHNGISSGWSEEVAPEEKRQTLNRLKIPERFLLFAATLQPKKNLPRLIEAYLQLPKEIIHHYPLIIVGKAGWKTEESLAAIQTLTDRKAGRWIQYVSQEELRVLYQSATLYLHPSLHEGFGLTILEAFASKTPVITSNITAMPEVAGDAAYLVDPYSVSDISSAIQKLLSSETQRRALVDKGVERVPMFSIEKSVGETVKVYQKILGKACS